MDRSNTLDRTGEDWHVQGGDEVLQDAVKELNLTEREKAKLARDARIAERQAQAEERKANAAARKAKRQSDADVKMHMRDADKEENLKRIDNEPGLRQMEKEENLKKLETSHEHDMEVLRNKAEEVQFVMGLKKDELGLKKEEMGLAYDYETKSLEEKSKAFTSLLKTTGQEMMNKHELQVKALGAGDKIILSRGLAATHMALAHSGAGYITQGDVKHPVGFAGSPALTDESKSGKQIMKTETKQDYGEETGKHIMKTETHQNYGEETDEIKIDNAAFANLEKIRNEHAQKMKEMDSSKYHDVKMREMELEMKKLDLELAKVDQQYGS